MRKSRTWALTAGLMLVSLILTACQGQQVQVPVTDVVQETSVVEQTSVVVETQVVNQTQVVEVTAEPAGAFTTPHPILSDLKVRQAIAHCTDRASLIKSVYPFVSEADQANQLMDTNIPRVSWAFYGGPEVQKYEFDPAKGMALLAEAGWTDGDGDGIMDKDGNSLSLKFTTTNAAFRQTWGAVFVQNMADCGINIVPLFAPASWWFGSTTGLRRRDYELGAYAWVGESDPKGQTLYACNQIPFPDNGWAGQNSMGWCNETASNAINAANNTFIREERIEQYKIFQIEFAKDLPSLPIFQRAEGNAATSNLVGFEPSATEYYSWNADSWSLADGGDTLVLGFSQEPASMYSIVESAAVQRVADLLVSGRSYTQVDYDFQPYLAKLSTVDSGLAVVAEVDVAEGDPVVDASGTPTDADGNLLTLTPGLMVKDSTGTDVEYASGTVKMNQLTVTYQWEEGLMWSDGTPVSKADFELAYKNDCDPESGAVDYSTCQSIQSVEFTSDTEYVVTYKPGYSNSLYFLVPIGIYPAHQVLSDGRKLADVPTTEWSSLPEIAETPMGVGPYILTSWEKGVRMDFEANPNYYKGEPAIKNITILFVADTQSAVAQLLTGDIDVVGSETLGAGAEVQTVIDAEAAGEPLQVLIEASATWEHIDFNLFLP
jgi:ABC-type transport system substrate-binding protein